MHISPCLDSWDACVVKFLFFVVCMCVDDGIIRNFLRVDACAKLADKVSSCHNS